MIPENTAANATYHGIMAAAVQFDIVRSILDTLDEDAARTLAQDVSAEYVVAFNRSLKQRVTEYLDART